MINIYKSTVLVKDGNCIKLRFTVVNTQMDNSNVFGERDTDSFGAIFGIMPFTARQCVFIHSYE